MEKSIPAEIKQPPTHGSNQSNPNHDNNSHISPLGGRHTPRNFDTPALRQLTEYARPHSAYPSFSHPSMAHHINPSNLNQLGIHAPGAQFEQIALAQLMMKERFEAEEKQKLALMEKQKQEMEMKSRTVSQSPQQHSSALPPTSTSNSLLDQHLYEMQRRLAPTLANSPSISNLPNNPSTSTANGMPLPAGTNPSSINPFMLFPSNERVAQEQMQQMAAAAALADRIQVDRLLNAASDPFLRLQMGLNPEMHGAPPGPNPAHAFQHPTHSVHQASHSSNNSNTDNAAAAAAAASMQLAALGLQGSQFDPALHSSHPLLQSTSYPSRPPSIMPRPELTQQSSLYRSFDDNLSHQVNLIFYQTINTKKLTFITF